MSAASGSRGTRGARVLLAMALLLLPAVVPVGAQTPTVNPGSVASITVAQRNLLEGQNLTIFPRGFEVGDRVGVECRACPERVRFETQARDVVVFPRDFGIDAVRSSQPRWNGTWDVSLLKSGAVTAATVSVNVTIVDVWRFEDRMVEPSDRVIIRSSGYPKTDPPSTVSIVISRQNLSFPGRRDVLFEERGLVPEDGVVHFPFRFGSGIASMLRCDDDPQQRCRKLRLDVSGGGKSTESYHFGARPKRYELTVLEEPSPEGAPEATLNRTLTPEMTFRLASRRGFDPLTWLSYDIGRGPEYHVERVLMDNVTVVHKAEARWSDAAFGWVANWTIPRDAAVSDPQTGLPYKYRFAIPAALDPSGNDISRNQSRPFQVSPFVLPWEFQRRPADVERAQGAEWRFRLVYGDGKDFTNQDNASQLRVCFFPKTEARPGPPCLNRRTVEIRNLRLGVWNIRNEWAVDEPRVGQEWVLAAAWTAAQPATDRYGNIVAPLELTFNLTPARPRVTLVTQVGDEKREGNVPLERGDLVKVTARITYPDGKTPFNRTRSADGARLPLLVAQKNSLGDTVGIDRVNLTNPGNDDMWVGSFQIGRTAETAPTGTWEFRLDLKDKVLVPNANLSVATRRVVPATILATTVREPPFSVKLGEPVQYRFRLNYRDPVHGGHGEVVTGDVPGLTVRAEVRPWNGEAAGPSVETLAPSWDAVRQEWVVDWRVPRSTPLLAYVIVPAGSDLSGNHVRGDVHSRPFQLYTETLARSVLRHPPPSVARGERVVAIFDGRDGDVGPNGTGLPVVQVQRFDSGSQAWFTEIHDVRAADEPGVEHVALWNTTLRTQAGTYRFALVGKDAQFAFVNATSREFLVHAIKVERAALSNGTTVAKGGTVKAVVERKAGDAVRDAYVLQDGRRAATIDLRRPDVDSVEVEWTVPFTFPTGAFSIVVVMNDPNGNEASGEVGPFFTDAAEVRSSPITDPTRVVARAKKVDWAFRSFYPSGDKLNVRSGMPTVSILNATGLVGTADVTFDGTNYVASWEVPKEAGTADHRFEVGGRDVYGNTFTPLESAPFRVEPGVLGRTIDLLPPAYNPRDVLTGFRIHTDPDDKVLSFAVVRLRATDAASALNNFQGAVVARGDVKPSPDGTLWVAEWRPPKDAPLGWYRFRIEGEDRFGNRVEQHSGAWQITASQLVTEFFRQSREVVPGQPYEVEFRIRYPDLSNLDDRAGRVAVEMTHNGQPMAPTPSLTFDRGTQRWAAVWPAPDPLPTGRYILSVSGFDVLGNVILRAGASAYDYQPTNIEKLLGIPGPGALLALLGVAAVAVGLGRRRSP